MHMMDLFNAQFQTRALKSTKNLIRILKLNYIEFKVYGGEFAVAVGLCPPPPVT